MKNFDNSNIIPRPLGTALEKLWGFTSEQGRHLLEGREPSFSEAQLTVGICATMITYLQSKYDPIIDNNDCNIPF